MNKFIVLVSFSNTLGGAQIRYLNLFNEITQRQNDYNLIINRELYEIARNTCLLNNNSENIIILECDIQPIFKDKTDINKQRVINNIKDNFFIIKLRKLRNNIISFKNLIKYVYKLYKIFNGRKPDYVYAIWIGGMIAWPLKYLFKFKLVYSFMDSGFSSIYKGLSNPLKNERLPLKHSDIIDYLSADLYHGVSERVKLKGKTKFAITPCSFKDYSKILPSNEKYNIVVFCSRLTPIKNPLLFLQSIKIFNEIYSQFQSITFQILGDGVCMPQLIEFKEKHNLSNVLLAGHVYNPIDYLRKSRIFVSIQQFNNYPSQSLIEAMACENAIIASDVGETRMLVAEDVGILVSLDADKIAHAVKRLFENKNMLKQYGKRARQKVLKEHNIERYLEYFYTLENM